MHSQTAVWEDSSCMKMSTGMISGPVALANELRAKPGIRQVTRQRRGRIWKGKERKGKKSIYIAPFRTKVHPKRSGMDHTVLPTNNTMPAFPSWRSPDVATTATEAADIQLQLTTHLSTPKG